MRAPSVKNLFMSALAGLLCGTLGQTLLFLESQSRRVEDVLAGDFRIVVFLAPEAPAGARTEVERELRRLSGTQSLRFVSREAALESLREQDPDLMRSVALLGENPLQSAFEAALAPESIGRAAQWADAAGKIAGVGDVRFKPLEVQAAVQCQFYSRFLRLALSLAAFFWLAGAAAGLWAAIRSREERGVLEGVAARLTMSAAGCAAGMGLVAVAAMPLRSAPAGWAAPSAFREAALFAAGILGALHAWDWASPARRPRGVAVGPP